MKNDNEKLKTFLLHLRRISLGLIVLGLPLITRAQGLLPCVGEECNQLGLCGLLGLALNVIKFAVEFSMVVVLIFIFWGGFLVLTAGANPANLSKGRSMIQNAIIGAVVVLVSWLFVDSILKIVAGQNLFSSAPANIPWFGPWNQINCQ